MLFHKAPRVLPLIGLLLVSVGAFLPSHEKISALPPPNDCFVINSVPPLPPGQTTVCPPWD